MRGLLRGIILWIGQVLGMDIFRKRESYHYVSDIYGHTAYKHIDIRSIPVFGELAERAVSQQRTTHYYDRLFTIYQGLKSIKQLTAEAEGYRLAELGVYKGGTAHFIASVIQEIHLNPVSIYCFDTFSGHSLNDIQPESDAQHRSGLFGDTSFDGVKDYLQPFTNISLLQGRFQDTCHAIQQYNFHFVHLDMDIYEPTRFALSFFEHRMAPGGIIIVDDYGFVSCPGAKRAVDEFLNQTGDFFSLHLLTGQCLLIRQSGGETA